MKHIFNKPYSVNIHVQKLLTLNDYTQPYISLYELFHDFYNKKYHDKRTTQKCF